MNEYGEFVDPEGPRFLSLKPVDMDAVRDEMASGTSGRRGGYGEAECRVCGRRFRKRTPNHRYCSNECSRSAARERRGKDV